jgi:Variant SH3 domain
MVFRCIRQYTVFYENPITVKRGDTVIAGKFDTEWPTFRWCTGPDSREGWMPENLLDEQDGVFTANTDYSAAELPVNEGDVVEGIYENGGWWWCRNSKNRQGWIPETHLEMIE